MCGRFIRTSSRDALAIEFGITDFVNVDFTPRYNVAPSQSVEAIIADGDALRLAPMRWGYTASASTDAKRPAPINARAETVHALPLFRDAFRQRRCLVVADGFYEWRNETTGKTPYFIRLRSGHPFGFAGIWSTIPTDVGRWIATCAILTCAPNELMATIHSRMPVIVPADARERWLDPASDVPVLRALLKPFPADQMDAYPVSRFVNSPRNDSPECIAAVSGST